MSTHPLYALPDENTIYRSQFANGITLLVYQNANVESVVLRGSLVAGSVFDTVEKHGLASVTAQLLMSGTQSRDFDALNGELEDIGAELDFTTHNFRVLIDGRALVEDLPTLIDVLADALHNSIFPEDELAQEITKRQTELNYAQQNPRYMAARKFYEALYPTTHPYHYSTYGSLESLATLTREDVVAYHAQQYSPKNMVLVIVGNVHPETAEGIIGDLLGDWDNVGLPEPVLPVVHNPSKIKRVHYPVADMSQTDIVIGAVGASRLDNDYRATTIANSILGEFAMMGRIGDIIREQLGLAYYAYSRLEGGQGRGAWHINIGTDPENVDLAIEKSLEEIAQLVNEPVSTDDLEDNQMYFSGRLPLRIESTTGLASALHTMQRYDLGLDYLVRYQDIINSITVEDVQKAAQHYLHPDRLVISTAGA